MKKYDGKVIYISETTSRLGDKCVILLPIHALTGFDTVAYPLGKGKISAANLLLKSDINLDAMCNIGSLDDTIIEIVSTVLLYLYGCHLQKLTLIATDTHSSTKKQNLVRLKSCHQLMKLLFHMKRACSYSSQTPCNSNHCSCHKAGLSCTSYCHCEAETNCGNENTVTLSFIDYSEEEEEFLF